MGVQMSADEFVSVVGGLENRRLRVVLITSAVQFGVFCTLAKVNEAGLSVTVAESSIIGMSIEGCLFGFDDSSPEGDSLLGAQVESGVVAVRDGFRLAVMVLRD
jgi:hypothetical protein